MNLNQVGCKLEPTKEVVVARWMGNKAHQKMQEFLVDKVITEGQKANVARYLGAWPQSNNKMATEITKHIQAMRAGFFAFSASGDQNQSHTR